MILHAFLWTINRFNVKFLRKLTVNIPFADIEMMRSASQTHAFMHVLRRKGSARPRYRYIAPNGIETPIF